MKFCDRSPLTVYPNTRLSRAYSVFQKLGMRHLPVVSEKGIVQGMITRKNLMHYLLTDQKEQELIKVKRVQRGAKLFLARRHVLSDAYFDTFASSPSEKGAVAVAVGKKSGGTTTQAMDMTLDDFTRAIAQFKIKHEVVFFPEVLTGAQLVDCMAFIGTPSGPVVSKVEFRVFLAKTRQWRMRAIVAMQEGIAEGKKNREEEEQVFGLNGLHADGHVG